MFLIINLNRVILMIFDEEFDHLLTQLLNPHHSLRDRGSFAKKSSQIRSDDLGQNSYQQNFQEPVD